MIDICPITREQVEEMWPGCQMCKGWNMVVYNKLLASGYIDFKFCPFCGSPKTDEAVDVVMKKLEALYEKKV